jgi:hypothetical protein
MATQPPIVMERSPVVSALEDAWATIRHHHPELPEVFIVVVAGSATDQHPGHRHVAAMRWQRDDQRLRVGEERLSRGPVVVLGTLLHEAAHALAHVRNISDTSRRSRDHPRRFAKLAEELGLEHERRLGWLSSTPTTDSIARYRTTLDNLDRALRIDHAQSTGGRNRTSSNNPVTCACDGGRRIRVSRITLGLGPIICQVCGSQVDSQ